VTVFAGTARSSTVPNRAAVGEYLQIEEAETRRFLKRVLAKPDQLQEHVRQYVLFILTLT
jgi:hypothetical protein